MDIEHGTPPIGGSKPRPVPPPPRGSKASPKAPPPGGTKGKLKDPPPPPGAAWPKLSQAPTSKPKPKSARQVPKAKRDLPPI